MHTLTSQWRYFSGKWSERAIAEEEKIVIFHSMFSSRCLQNNFLDEKMKQITSLSETPVITNNQKKWLT